MPESTGAKSITYKRSTNSLDFLATNFSYQELFFAALEVACVDELISRFERASCCVIDQVCISKLRIKYRGLRDALVREQSAIHRNPRAAAEQASEICGEHEQGSVANRFERFEPARLACR